VAALPQKMQHQQNYLFKMSKKGNVNNI